MFHFQRIKGKSPVFWGHNKYGWWFGANLVPSRFGVYLDWTETHNPNETVFILTREDVLLCAGEMGIPEKAITDDVFYQVKKGVEWGLESWSEVMKEAISFALKS